MPVKTSITLADIPVLSGRPEDQAAWKAHSACFNVDADIFYPERGQDVRPAKAICAHCPAKMACLAYAIRNGERLGIWGGLTERERRRLRRGLPLSVQCIYCARVVKAGGLNQQTCNRQECKDRFAAGHAPAVFGGDIVELEDLADMEAAEENEKLRPLPLWVETFDSEQLLLFPSPDGATVIALSTRQKRVRAILEPQGEQLAFTLLLAVAA